MVLTVNQVFEKVVGLLWTGEINEEKVRERIKGLPAEEIPNLIQKLKDRKKEERKLYEEEVRDIQAEVDHRLAFGGPSAISASMADYYDEDVRVSHRGMEEKITRINWIIDKLERIQSKQIKVVKKMTPVNKEKSEQNPEDKSRQPKRKKTKKVRTCPPVVANAIAQSYGHTGAWKNFITETEIEVEE